MRMSEWVSIDKRYHNKQNLAILITYQLTWSLLALSFLSLLASADISSTWAANWEWKQIHLTHAQNLNSL